MEYPAFQIVQIFSYSVWLLVLTVFTNSGSSENMGCYTLYGLIVIELAISCALFVHFAQGPHFIYSKLSIRGQSQSRGLIHRDIASELPCFGPGLYFTVKSNEDNISIHLAIQPFGSIRLKSHIKA